ncbi:hypothetical protein Mapa_013980 [Marchantia paleacea]|nr:hypothetical protein Mapa_013980 [Marchantia paleacea]
MELSVSSKTTILEYVEKITFPAKSSVLNWFKASASASRAFTAITAKDKVYNLHTSQSTFTIIIWINLSFLSTHTYDLNSIGGKQFTTII